MNVLCQWSGLSTPSGYGHSSFGWKFNPSLPEETAMSFPLTVDMKGNADSPQDAPQTSQVAFSSLTS